MNLPERAPIDGGTLSADLEEKLRRVLDGFRVEVPSWGFGNTGTRFGKYADPTAATNVDEKLRDAAEVHRFTGCCPTAAIHVLWDLPDGDPDGLASKARSAGIGIGSINPNLFEDQRYKFGSLANPSAEIRAAAIEHLLDAVRLGQRLESRDVSLWLADGSNYPGSANIRRRRQHVIDALTQAHERLADDQRLLVEYKPFEPAFYHTDLADWGMALRAAEAAGERAMVLVDTGHHYAAQNIEQIVAWLLAEGRLGGFHFNDRRYADDDLTLGSIDPYQLFRIFHEIAYFEWETGDRADVAYMIDQSHNVKPKIEAMIQSVTTAQELFARAALVDHERLSQLQSRAAVVDAEECLKEAFYTDVRPVVGAWRRDRGLPENPLQAFRESGYAERVTEERRGQWVTGSSYA